MKNYAESVNQIQKNIIQKLDKGHNIVLIGDNSSGKSDILKKIVQEYLERKEQIYYIDAVNRKFDITKVTFSARVFMSVNRGYGNYLKNGGVDFCKEEFMQDVLNIRLDQEHFNIQDSFAFHCAEQLYHPVQKEVEQMCKEFMNIDFKISRGYTTDLGIGNTVVLVNGNEVMLSNGYQALVRIFTELLYVQKYARENEIDRVVVIIDEVDKYLSPFYTAKIFPYLQEQFPQFIWCLTTHSKDLLKYASNFTLCPLVQEADGNVEYEFITSESDLGEKQIERIFSDLFFEEERAKTSSNNEIDNQLRRFLNLKLSEAWDNGCEQEFSEIPYEELEQHQKLLYRQIKEW